MPFAIALFLQGDTGVLAGFLGIAVLFILGIALLIIAAKTIRIVPQASVMLIERLGRFAACFPRQCQINQRPPLAEAIAELAADR